MAKRRKKAEPAPTWDCPVCCLQMVGGDRCYIHNPTPEQRQAHPERYRREEYAPSYKRP